MEATGQDDFTATDLETMHYTNAAIKETLRYHPVSPWVTRESAIDDVIPLVEPITTVSGKTIKEIPIGRGVPVLVSTCAYNRSVVSYLICQRRLTCSVLFYRLKSVWGEDADVWNPVRFLDPTLKDRQIPVGLVANLLTFSGGTSGCIGYVVTVRHYSVSRLTDRPCSIFLFTTTDGALRKCFFCTCPLLTVLTNIFVLFSLTEMQSTVVDLVENFEFAPPPKEDNVVMLRAPVGPIMTPMIKGKFELRTQMPLSIRSLR